MTRARNRHDEIDVQAREWVVSLASNNLTDAEVAGFKAWLAADHRHQNAYNEVRRIWTGIGQLGHLKGAASLEDLDRFAVANDLPSEALRPQRLRGIRRLAAGGLAAAALIAVLLVTGQLLQVAGPGEEYQTATAEVREISLPDGSMVTLGAQSDLGIAFTGSERRVTLLSGEGYFSVVKDPSRPFFVVAGDTVVRVVGTKFEVRHGFERVRVAVAEGIVEIVGREEIADRGSSEKAGAVTVLTAGQQFVAAHGVQLEPVKKISESAPGAWRDGRLYYEDAMLWEVIADANRYYYGRIEIQAPEISSMRITGSFRTARIDQMLASLEQVLPVEVERTGDGRVVLRDVD